MAVVLRLADGTTVKYGRDGLFDVPPSVAETFWAQWSAAREAAIPHQTIPPDVMTAFDAGQRLGF